MLHAQGTKSLLVAEVFSPPRFAKAVEGQGFRAVSYDIRTSGHDFTRKSTRLQVAQELREDPPELLVVCPPCTDEGGWFHLNSKSMSPKEVLKRKARSRTFIKYSCELFREQVERGGRAVLEHPLGSKLWSYPEVAKLCRQHQVVKCHMCRFGLRLPDSERLIRKGTKLLVSHNDMKTLARECPGRNDPHHSCHDVIAGSHPQVGAVSRFAGQYTPSFVEAVLETVPAYHASQVFLAEPDQETEVLSSEERDTLQNSEDDQNMNRVLGKVHRNLGHPPNSDLVRILKHGKASDRAVS